jgi:hypothetical protein
MFPSLKQDKQWDHWQRAVIAQARAQDLSDLLQPKFSPVRIEGSNLFAEKQKFMYAIFERTLLSDKGKSLVRLHLNDYNAQKLYTALCEYSLQSAKASIDSRDLLQYITLNRLGDGTWKGSTHAYILHWQDQVRRYEDLVPSGDHFSGGQKKAMIKNAVAQVDELRVVKTQAAHDQVRTGKALDYDKYVSLLLSASQTYDNLRLQKAHVTNQLVTSTSMHIHLPTHIPMTLIATYVTFLIWTFAKSTMLPFNADPNSTRINGLDSPQMPKLPGICSVPKPNTSFLSTRTNDLLLARPTYMT